MGAVDKHTLYRATKKFFKPVDDVNSYQKLLAAETVKNDTATLMAAECCYILMLERDVSPQLNKKSLKRE